MHINLKVPQSEDDIQKDIHQSNTELNNTVQKYLDCKLYQGESTTVQQWRLNNYKQLRRWAYPKVAEYNDAQVKLNSGIPELEQQGQEQLDQYIQDCLDIKIKFPKGIK